MKIWAIAAMAITAAGTASARNVQLPMQVPTEPGIPVCVETTGSSSAALFLAEGLTSKMFVAAGVTIDWRRGHNCPADGIRISVSEDTPDADHPHAYAYALPYEGAHIVLFQDRIQAAAGQRAQPFLLAHVLVHELTHILEGTCRHSDTGILKAVFTQADIAQMELHPLPFAEEDLELIHFGLEIRRNRAAQ